MSLNKLKFTLCAAGILTAGFGIGSHAAASAIVKGKRQTLEQARAWQDSRYDTSWFDTLETEAYTVRSFDGYELHVVLCRNPEPSDRYVIISHGYTDNRFGALKYMKNYLDRGYNCLIYDLRGHGENEPQPCTYSVREGKDLRVLIEDTRKRYGLDILLGLHGESLGAAASIACLKTHPDVDFAVADCGFSDIRNVLEGVMARQNLPSVLLNIASFGTGVFYGFSLSDARPIDSLADNHVPLLFLHGEDDTFITPDNSRRMADATAGYSELHLIPGAGHAQSALLQPELYREYLYGFLDRVEDPA